MGKSNSNITVPTELELFDNTICIKDFEVIQPIGEGGFGRVYQVDIHSIPFNIGKKEKILFED